MSFFTTVPAKTNPIGDSFLGGFNEGIESVSRERDLASATKRQHYLQEELYKEDYQKAKPSLDAIINNEAWSPSQKQIEIERSAEIPLSVKDRATKAYNNQVAEQQKVRTQKAVQAFKKESTEFVSNALGIVMDLKGDAIPTPGLKNFRDLTPQQLREFSTLNDLYENNLLQGDSQPSAWARAKEDFEKNKTELMAKAQAEEKLANDLHIQEIRDYEKSAIADKVKLVMQNPQTTDREKVIELVNEGLTSKEALDIVRKRENAEAPIKRLGQKENSERAYEILRNADIPKIAKQYAAHNSKALLTEPVLKKLKQLGVDDNLIRLMKRESRKATREELGRAYEEPTENAIVKWLKENELEE